jgi:hypothetical protein
MIPSSMKFSMEGATPTFEDNDGQTITAGGHVRLRIKGIRSELNQMFAIGSIREDYLGYELALFGQVTPITDRDGPLALFSTSRCSDNCDTAKPTSLSLQLHGGRHGDFLLSCSCYYSGVLPQSGLQRGVGDMGRERKRREKNNHIKARKAMFTFFMSSNKIPNRNKSCPFSLLSGRLTNSDLPSTSLTNQ